MKLQEKYLNVTMEILTRSIPPNAPILQNISSDMPNSSRMDSTNHYDKSKDDLTNFGSMHSDVSASGLYDEYQTFTRSSDPSPASNVPEEVDRVKNTSVVTSATTPASSSILPQSPISDDLDVFKTKSVYPIETKVDAINNKAFNTSSVATSVCAPTSPLMEFLERVPDLSFLLP